MRLRFLALMAWGISSSSVGQNGAMPGVPRTNSLPQIQLPLPSDIIVQRRPPAIRLPRPGESAIPSLFVRDWRKKMEQVTIPAGPSATGGDIIIAAAKLGAGCAPNDRTYPCREAAALASAGRQMQDAGKAFPACDAAASQFRVDYEQTDIPMSVRRDYDLACLGSFVPRSGETSSTMSAERPALLAGAEADGGLLEMIGLLEVDGQVTCAGLLRRDRIFITARHCIQGLGGAALKVRSAAKKFAPIGVKAQLHPKWSDLGVAADWASLTLDEGPPLPVPGSRLIPLALPGEISLVGFYLYADPSLYTSASASFERDLRFPKKGLCQAVERVANCLQIACQTVRGFSGSPILGARGADGAVEVLGFLSSADGNDTGCEMNSDVRYSSFAVSATAVTAN